MSRQRRSDLSAQSDPGPFSTVTELAAASGDAISAMTRFALENADDAVFWIGPDLRIFYVNGAACRLLGYARERLLQMRIDEIDRPLAEGQLDDRVDWALLRARKALRFESTHLKADGSVVPVEISANYMCVGGLELSCAFVRDVSVRHRVLEALESSRRWFSDLVNTIDGVVWEADATTLAFTFISEQARELFGYPLENWAEPGFWVSCIHPDDRAWAVSYCAEATRRRQAHSFDYRVICSNGEVRWIRDIVAVVVEDDRPAYVRGVMLDVTQRHEAEEKLRLLAGVFEHAHEGIMITDTDARILDVNPAFTEITGHPREQALGRRNDLLRPAGPAGQAHKRMWQQLRRNGFWRGELWSRHRDGNLFPELRNVSAVRDAHGAVNHYVCVFSDISQIKHHQEQLEQMAHYDTLTRLPNRVLLADRLRQAIARADRAGGLLAVCYLDLDGFKPVNDAHGHAAGDRLLVEVGERLKRSLRSQDTVARLGGDEFVLLLTDHENVDSCEYTLQRVLAALSRPFALGRDVRVRLSGSVGVTLYPHDPVDADTLIRHADQALYATKQQGRAQYRFFDLEYERRTRVQQRLLQQLEQALVENQLRLHYQPKVNLRSGQVLGMEALLRWQHPQQGLLPPGCFLPQIEHTPLVASVGDWVLGQALAQQLQWQRQGWPLSMSINIATGHLTRPDFVARLEYWLQRHPELDPARVELELLETAALDDIAEVTEVIEQCRRLGVRFALDDFGTGYSSLTYLRRLPADVLKVDQTFVRDMLTDPDDLTIVEGVIGLTRAFSRAVVAEGVESVEHGMLLIPLGCEVAQGYGIARPMPSEAVPVWLRTFRPDPLWQRLGTLRWPRHALPLLVAGLGLHRAVTRRMEDIVAGNGEMPDYLPPFSRWRARQGLAMESSSDLCETFRRVHRRIAAFDSRWCENQPLDEQALQMLGGLCASVVDGLIRWQQRHVAGPED